MSSRLLPITYLFDPLCGWCYGAAPQIERLAQHPGIELTLAPTGLFAGAGARPMDARFAAYAWSNDQRIQQLTGQPFSERYREALLNHPAGGRFDSGPSSLALTAVQLSAPVQELATLKRMQGARYLQGLDTSDTTVLAQLLRDAALPEAAERLLAPDAALLDAHELRVQQAQALMRKLGAQGVPGLVLTQADGQQRLLRGDVLYGRFEALLAQLAGR
ncbi:DsbA family protein [Roseateles sp.]|jgi:putative protein-disulfide isomerase|uniref:DsbA family protein n=1 Tax=Roseateles sp. TaxID=1971397 RepID=UPI0037C6554E